MPICNKKCAFDKTRICDSNCFAHYHRYGADGPATCYRIDGNNDALNDISNSIDDLAGSVDNLASSVGDGANIAESLQNIAVMIDLMQGKLSPLEVRTTEEE